MAHIELPEVDELRKETLNLKREIGQLKSLILPQKAWFTREECCALKGINPKTLEKYPWLYPNFNKPQRVGRRSMFSLSDVLEWLPKTDEQLKAEWDAAKVRIA